MKRKQRTLCTQLLNNRKKKQDQKGWRPEVQEQKVGGVGGERDQYIAASLERKFLLFNYYISLPTFHVRKSYSPSPSSYYLWWCRNIYNVDTPGSLTSDTCHRIRHYPHFLISVKNRLRTLLRVHLLADTATYFNRYPLHSKQTDTDIRMFIILKNKLNCYLISIHQYSKTRENFGHSQNT